MNQPPRGDSPFPVFAVVLGVWSVVLVLVSGGAAAVVAKRYRDARKGWNLVPVVVVAVDLPAREEITMDVLSQRSAPEQFVTESVVRPDEVANVVGRRVHSKLVAGDPLLWRDLLPPGAPERLEADAGTVAEGAR